MTAISYRVNIMKYLCDISVRDINVALLVWCGVLHFYKNSNNLREWAIEPRCPEQVGHAS